MNLAHKYTLRVVEPGASGPVSRARKQFNILIEKLDDVRSRLAGWKALMPAIMRQADQQYQPLVQACYLHQKALVLLLDQIFLHKSLSKRERTKVARLICTTALELLACGDDAELKGIYNCHSGDDFDEQAEEDGAAIVAMIKDRFGVQLEADANLRSPEAVMKALAAQMSRNARDKQRAAQASEGSAPQRKSAGALAREERQAAAMDKVKQTVRDIFRKLASQFHPDREQDITERARKTALMQRVNVAYAGNDLLGLLELQLEVEQIDQAGLNNLGDERIRQYNKILEGQLRGIAGEITGFEQSASMQIGGKARIHLTPETLLRGLLTDIADMQAKHDAVVAQLVDFRDINKLKAWLKIYRPFAAYEQDDVGRF